MVSGRTDPDALARDHRVSRSTAYRYHDEVIAVLAACAPDLHDVLEQAHDENLSYVILDGKLFAADRYAETTTSVKGKPIDL